ncbi:nitronate monooxygenase [Streptomyces radicis]|uniref:Probable nitronate monooxygenase n=1 Tax=Streptomyces radicis TaxID=1750517 RepID=A0A3A9WD51_9ACTN|nr:nitronate monooxygenase [Streptomyces radicis]RKN10915.1 nitronate monooxygenase [Streptomyces radicis]RKN25178.1 nitronate monooxygenase [Streptomyces radicis]
MSFRIAVPLVAAPMAGGVSTPELVAAVSGAGGLGFLAAGYRTAGAMVEQIGRTRRLTDRPFGVNIFVPGPPADLAAVAAYRRRLLPEAEAWNVTLPSAIQPDRDDWEAKLVTLIADPVPYVSYTFGLPTRAEADAVRAAGSVQIGTVTTPEEARAAAALGLDALTVQGPEAGGHRATHRADEEPGTLPLLPLIAAVREVTGLPLIAAGGLADGEGIAAALRAGADAVQLGTAYLRTDESGASDAHRRALREFGATTVTRAFTGRPARGLRNAFIDRHQAHAPAAYPEVHHLTAPLRAAAARRGDPEGMHLWAGTGHRLARTGSAAELTRALWREASTFTP